MRIFGLLMAMTILIMIFSMPNYAFDFWDIPGTYDVTSEKPSTFVITEGKSITMQTKFLNVQMIGESSERDLEFIYDNMTGEARMEGKIGDVAFDDLMYIKFDFSGSVMRGEGYMRWGEKGEEKILFSMVKIDGADEMKWPSAGKIEVPKDKNGKPIDSGFRFSSISGEANVRPGDDLLAWDFAELDQVLYHGDVLRLKRGAEVQLSMPDMAVFVLRGPAEIIISLGPENENKMMLLVGKVIRNVKKMVTEGSIDMELSQAIAGARGTVYAMEEDGVTSTLKVLEGTVSFKPTNGEEILITEGQMVTATDGVASEVISFSIDDELSSWNEETQTIFRSILNEVTTSKQNEASQEKEASQENDTTDELIRDDSDVKKPIPVFVIGIASAGVLIGLSVYILSRVTKK